MVLPEASGRTFASVAAPSGDSTKSRNACAAFLCLRSGNDHGGLLQLRIASDGSTQNLPADSIAGDLARDIAISPACALPDCTNCAAWLTFSPNTNLPATLVFQPVVLERRHGGPSVGRMLRVGDGNPRHRRLGLADSICNFCGSKRRIVWHPQHEMSERIDAQRRGIQQHRRRPASLGSPRPPRKTGRMARRSGSAKTGSRTLRTTASPWSRSSSQIGPPVRSMRS